MPCRALEAFRPMYEACWAALREFWVLMPCRALEAFRLRKAKAITELLKLLVLMPCRALEAFRHWIILSLVNG